MISRSIVRRAHHLAVLVCAVSVAIATLGIPLPQQMVKDTSEPFPCMHCGCGCTNATMCWKECCCFSTEEKLAWAKEHGIRPPAFLVAAARKPNCCEKEGGKKTCCSAAHKEEMDAELAKLKPCCRARALAARKAAHSSCCQQQPGAKEIVPLPGIIAIHALKCRGHSLTVSLLPPSLLTLRDLGVEPSPQVVGRLICLDEFYFGQLPAPTLPPPRRLG